MIRPQECYAGARQCMVLSTLTSSFVACGRAGAFHAADFYLVSILRRYFAGIIATTSPVRGSIFLTGDAGPSEP